MGWCVERAGSREEFIQPLRAAKLCAPGMVVVCRNAAVLSHHRAPLVRAHSLLSLFPFSFFFSLFLIRDLVSGIIKVKEIGDWRAVVPNRAVERDINSQIARSLNGICIDSPPCVLNAYLNN